MRCASQVVCLLVLGAFALVNTRPAAAQTKPQASKPQATKQAPATNQTTTATQNSKDAAMIRYKRAQELFTAKRYEQALALFQAVAKQLDSPNASFMAARCLRELGRTIEAWEAMGATVKMANRRSKTSDRYLATRDAAAAQREVLNGQIGRVVLAVAASHESMSITVNGKPVAPEKLGSELGVAPGSLEVVATAAGRKRFQKRMQVNKGQRLTVVVTLEPLAVNEPADKLQPQRDRTKKVSAAFVTGTVVAALGVAGWVTFAVAGSMASSEFADLERDCGTPPCTDPAKADAISRGKTLDLVANIGLVAGAVGVAAGTTLMLVGSLKNRSEPAVGIVLLPLGLGMRGHF